MRRLLFFVLLISTLSISAQDDCSTALPIDLGVQTVDLVDGTAPSLNCSGNNNTATLGEWFAFTPASDISLTVSSSLPQNEGGDTRLHIYSGTCDNLQCLGGDDDGGDGFLSIATVSVIAGQTYYISFDNGWNANGFDFELSEGDVIEPSEISFSNGGNYSADAIVDMNRDGLDDVVNVSGASIVISYQQTDGSLETVTIPTSDPANNPSWSLCAGDIDGNGFTDLMYGGGSGVTFMFANEDGTEFNEVSGNEYVFCQRTNMVDLNNDGNLDAFSCHDVDPNVYYINDGEGNLSFYQGGLGNTEAGGNYGSIWVDYNNDQLPDLFIAKCRGGNSEASTDQMHQNMGNGVFQEVAADLNLADDIQTWSSAWGDFDNDGDMDVFVGASSTTNGGHKLMRNDDGMFVNVTVGSGFDLISSTNIENCTQDFNNDGYLDILGAGGDLFLNNGDMTFSPTTANISNGPIGDVNSDGYLDVGNGSGLYLNNGGDNNYLRVYLEGVESNSMGIGARIEVTTALGTQIRDVRAGEGFRYMSSITAHFGLGADEEIEQVAVLWPSGEMDVLSDVQINSTLRVTEGSAVGVAEFDANDISVYPSVTDGALTLRTDATFIADAIEIIDNTGRTVLQFNGQQRQFDLSSLAAGRYTFNVIVGSEQIQKPFVKQ